MEKDETNSTPQVIDFKAEGVSCKAFVMFGERSLNMRSCQVNLGKQPTVNIEYLPDRTRVRINEGQVWFDTDGISAAKIEALFETGNVP